jgi:allantoinase
MISTDHSPSAPEMKLLEEGDFLNAWGGISSLQFVLPVTWTYGASRGITLEQLVKWWSTGPSKLANFPRKVFSLFFLYIFLEKNARIDFGWFCEFNK